jgi:hypothetical protein
LLTLTRDVGRYSIGRGDDMRRRFPAFRVWRSPPIAFDFLGFFPGNVPIVYGAVMFQKFRLDLDAQEIRRDAGAFAHGMPTDTVGAELARAIDNFRRQYR